MLELNTIHLGDSYKLIKNIPDKSIDLIYTDIPYLYDIGGAGGNSRVAKSKARIIWQNKEKENRGKARSRKDDSRQKM